MNKFVTITINLKVLPRTIAVFRNPGTSFINNEIETPNFNKDAEKVIFQK